jgi:hypothetical protein
LGIPCIFIGEQAKRRNGMDIGAAAFWIFLAAIIVAGIWRKKHSEAVRHETARLIIEKNQKLDEAQLKELLNPTPPPPPEWLVPKYRIGVGYRILRISGTILMFMALGLVLVACWRGMVLGIHDKSVIEIATGIPLIAMLGAGLFVASRYAPPPPPDDKKGN